MIARDGLPIVVTTFVMLLFSVLIWYLYPMTGTLVLMIVLAILALFNLYFFRDPERKAPINPLAVFSPADGKVVQIVNMTEPEYFNKEVKRISIFLSVFNVHVNRTPISGRVDYLQYHPGKFLAAFDHKASLDNEQTAIGMVDQYGHRVLFKQIAGLIARRIVCHLRMGQVKRAGERMGMIRYGSRVDVFVSPEARITVKQGQVVKGGESILAIFPDEGNQSSEQMQDIEMPFGELSN